MCPKMMLFFCRLKAHNMLFPSRYKRQRYALADVVAVYQPRKPQESPLWQLLNEHFHHFVSEYENSFQKAYGLFRKVVSEYLLTWYRIYEVIRRLKCALDACSSSALCQQHPVSRYRRTCTDLLRSYISDVMQIPWQLFLIQAVAGLESSLRSL